LLANGRWFSPGTPASSTTKIGRHDIDERLLKVALSTINQSINITQQLKHLITMYKLFCRMHSHYLHKTLGQSYYPTAEDFDYHVRQSIEMLNNCSRRKGLRACLYDSDLYKKMRVSSPLLYGFDNHHLFLYMCCDLVCFVLFLSFVLSSSWVLCTQYCQCLWVVPSGLPLRFSLTLILCMNKACEPENYSMYLLGSIKTTVFLS
jgi:hypothetical protein